MFRFEHSIFLWGLVFIPLMMVIYYLLGRWRQQAMQRFAEAELMEQLMPNRSQFKRKFKFVAFVLAVFFLIVGIANPQIGTKVEEVKREGIDMMLALDVSNSMKAEDLSPNRLERAKRGIAQLIDQLKGDRMGMIVFAGQAYTQLPITADYSAAKLFLGSVDTDIVPTQGTAIGAAIELASRSFSEESEGSKVVIVITDGENHEDDAVSYAEEAAKKGIRIFTVGMGTPIGAPIPLIRNKKLIGHRKDGEGNTVISSLNENMLQEIALAGRGAYVRASNASSGLETVMEELRSMQTGEYESQLYTDYEDRFQFFLGAALFFLFVSILLSEKKSQWTRKINLFEP